MSDIELLKKYYNFTTEEAEKYRRTISEKSIDKIKEKFDRLREYITDKSPQEIATRLYELSKDMDYMDYEDEKERILNDLENALYYIDSVAKNEYNADYFRTFYKALERL